MRTLKLLGLGLMVIGCGGELDVGKDQPAMGGAGGNVESGSGGKSAMASGGVSVVSGGKSGTEAEGGASANSGGKVTALSGGKAGEEVGYGGKPGEVGYGGKNAAGSPPVAPEPYPTWRTNCEGAKAVDVTGVWEGQTEDFLFRPIEQYRLEIAGILDGALCGTLLVGSDVESVSPAKDPAEVYPPDSDSESKRGSLVELLPGFTYTVADGAIRGNAVRFQVAISEARRTWCELQTPYELRPDQYACLPGEGWGVGFEPEKDAVCTVTAPDGTETHPSVAQCYQCMDCVCATDGCTARVQGNVLADLTLADDALTGPFNGGTLVLRRVIPAK